MTEDLKYVYLLKCLIKSVKKDQMKKKLWNFFLLKNNSGPLLGDVTDKKRCHFTIFGVRKSQF